MKGELLAFSISVYNSFVDENRPEAQSADMKLAQELMCRATDEPKGKSWIYGAILLVVLLVVAGVLIHFLTSLFQA